MDVNEQISANLGLVYHLLGKFNMLNDQDAESLAYEALYKAIKTFDEDANIAFSTYATCVISNAIRMHIRHLNRKRQLQVMSYYSPISADDENSGFLLDTLSVQESVENVVILDELRNRVPAAIHKVMQEIPEKQRHIIILWRKSDFKATQSDIAAKVGVSQAAVSRVISNFKYKLKLELGDYL